MTQAGVMPSAGSQWDGLRAYEKRLGTAISKDKSKCTLPFCPYAPLIKPRSSCAVQRRKTAEEGRWCHRRRVGRRWSHWRLRCRRTPSTYSQAANSTCSSTQRQGQGGSGGGIIRKRNRRTRRKIVRQQARASEGSPTTDKASSSKGDTCCQR